MVNLLCGIVGEAGDIFGVNIDDGVQVCELKKAIADELEYNEPADKLQLFLAKKDEGRGPWLTEEEVKNGVSDTTGLKLLRQHIGDAGLSEDAVRLQVTKQEVADLKGPVNVLVWAPSAATEWSMQLRNNAELEAYMRVAHKIRDSKEVTEMVDVLMKMHKDIEHFDDLTMRFVVLENSSGTGKTQMAFNLMATGTCDVFYVVCGPVHREEHQSIYSTSEARSAALEACIASDMEKVRVGAISEFNQTSSMMLYSFIVAALRGDGKMSVEKTRADVKRALKHHWESTGKPFVFFLDEFPRVRHLKGAEMEERTKKARILRNVFRSFHILTVLSATNGTARDLVRFSAGSRGSSSTNTSTPWCVVVPSLPAFVPTIETSPWLMWILERSRPLFAHRAEQYMVENPYSGGSGNDQLQYLTTISNVLVTQFRGIKQRSAEREFELGQFCMLLGSSYTISDGHANLIDGHYGRLEETTPVQLALSNGETVKYTKFVKDRERWKFRCRFPAPSDDLLLHLTLMGDHDLSSGEKQRPLQYPVCKEWRSFKVPNFFNTSNRKSNDGIALEALVTAAVVLASRRGGYYGVTFPAFLGRLLYELGVVDDVDAIINLPKQLKKDAVIPYLSMPNMEWPEAFLQYWQESDAKFGNMVRTPDKERIDFKVSPNDSNGWLCLSGECKDRETLDLGALKIILSVYHVCRTTQTSIW